MGKWQQLWERIIHHNEDLWVLFILKQMNGKKAESKQVMSDWLSV